MNKKTYYVCQNCGAQSLKWEGRCNQCQKWNTLQEEKEIKHIKTRSHTFQTDSQVIPLSDKSFHKTDKIKTGINELDRVLGGGIVQGGYILLGGSPGIGKSTLVLHISQALSRHGKVLYVCAEESAYQTSLRAERLGIKSPNILLYNEPSLDKIIEKTKSIQPQLLIIDSIQSVYLQELQSAPGTVSQVRECAGHLMNFAKSSNTAILIVGHVTKDGSLAGPRVLEHMVDTVLSFEGQSECRILKALKNRFGAINEVGVFQMKAEGLKEVTNPSEFFLEERRESRLGSAVFSTIEGRRPLLCEIQALTVSSFLPLPRRTSIGIEVNRLHLILAVLEKYCQISLSKYDVFLNLVGGLKLTEPAADMAVAIAILSSYQRISLSMKFCFFGEIGLTGEMRSSPHGQERINEAQKLGFTQIFIPEGNKKHLEKNTSTQIKITPIKNVQQLKDFLIIIK